VSHASSISKRFSDQKAIHQPGPKTVNAGHSNGQEKTRKTEVGASEPRSHGVRKTEVGDQKSEGRDQRAEDGGPLLNRFHVQRGKQKAEIASQGFRFQDPLKFRNEGW